MPLNQIDFIIETSVSGENHAHTRRVLPPADSAGDMVGREAVRCGCGPEFDLLARLHHGPAYDLTPIRVLGALLVCRGDV